MPNEKKKVTEKSTKTDLWQAYQEAISGVADQTTLTFEDEKKEADLINKNIFNIRSKVIEELTKINEEVETETSNFAEFQAKINKKKKEALEKLEEDKKNVENEMVKVKNNWQDEISEREKKNAREKEEYVYQLELSRKKEKEEYLEKRKFEEDKLLERKAKIDEREKEISQMEKDIASFAKTLETEVANAKSELTSTLSGKYEADIKEIKLINEHNEKMAKFQIEELNKKVAENTKIIEKLEQELSAANREVKEIAVSVIENRGGNNTSVENNL